MSEPNEGAEAIFALFATLSFLAALFAWGVVLPTIGLLYLVGYLT